MRFWYFDPSKASDVWHFPFRRISNIEHIGLNTPLHIVRRRSQTVRRCVRQLMFTSFDIFWCQIVYFSVLWCLKMWRGRLMSFLKVIGVLIIDVSKVWVPLRGYMSVQAMYAAPIVLFYIGKAPKGKISHTWRFWNIRIAKPPYIGSLKSLDYCTFLNFWVRQKKITIHSLFGSLCISINTALAKS